MTFKEKLTIFVRIHFLQCVWNYKGMQNLGCLVALKPFLKRLYSGDEYADAEKRQSQYFNTHPYFAPICLGVTAKLEEELKEGKLQKPEMIQILKGRMSGPLAAVGDAFFWETLRPVIGSLAAFCIYVFSPGDKYAVYALLFLLAVYIVSIEWIRWIGFNWGYKYGLNVVDVLKKRDFHGSMKRIRNIGAFLIGIVGFIYIIDGASFSNVYEIVVRMIVLMLLIAGTIYKWSPTLLLYFTLIIGIIIGGII